MKDSSRKNDSLTARALWLTIAKTFAFACTIAVPMLLTRRLSQAEFGIYKQVFLIIGTAYIVLPLGFGMSAFYFLPRERERQAQVVCNILFFNIVVGALACLALVLRPTLLAVIFGDPEMVEYAPLIGVCVLLWIVSSFLDVAPIAHEETKLASIFVIVMQLTKTLLLLAAAVSFASVKPLLWAAIVQGVLQTVLLLFYLRSRWPGFWRRFDPALLRAQIAYALPLGLAGLIYTLQTDLHLYFVSNRFDPAIYAVYAVGCFQLPLAGILGEAAAAVMIPRINQLQKQGARREIILLTTRAMRKLAAVFFPLCVFLLVTGREFITFLFTSRYLDAWPVFVINLGLLPLGVLIFDPIVRAFKEQSYFLLKLRVLSLGVLLAALWFGTLRFGLVGAIGAVVALSLIERLIIVARIGRLLGVTGQDWRLLKDVGKLAVAAAAAGIVTALVRLLISGAQPFVVLAACGVVLALAYAMSVLLLGVVTPDERAMIQNKLANSLRSGLRVWQRRAHRKQSADSLV